MFHLGMKVPIVAGVCYCYSGTRKNVSAEPAAGDDGCGKTWPVLTRGSWCRSYPGTWDIPDMGVSAKGYRVEGFDP